MPTDLLNTRRPSASEMTRRAPELERAARELQNEADRISTRIRAILKPFDGLPTDNLGTATSSGIPDTVALNLAHTIRDFAPKGYVRLGEGRAATTRIIHTREGMQAYLNALAERELQIVCGPLILAHHVHHVAQQVKGLVPIQDDSGTTLTGHAALVRRAEQFNYWHCQVVSVSSLTENGKTTTRDQRRVSSALAVYAQYQAALADDLPTVKVQLLERFDDHVKARCEDLFETPQPNGANQEAAYYAMRKARQGLVRRLKTAGTITAAKSDQTNAIATVDAVTVALSPAWQKVGGDPIAAVPPVLADAYTKGRSRWHLDLHAYTPTALDKRESHGAVEVSPLESDDFEMTDLAGATHGDAKVRIRRKGNGHPAAGSYELKLTARNFEGPTTLTVTVTVT